MDNKTAKIIEHTQPTPNKNLLSKPLWSHINLNKLLPLNLLPAIPSTCDYLFITNIFYRLFDQVSNIEVSVIHDALKQQLLVLTFE